MTVRSQGPRCSPVLSDCGDVDVLSAGSAPAPGAGFGALAKPSAAQANRSARAPTGAAEAAALPALNGYTTDEWGWGEAAAHDVGMIPAKDQELPDPAPIRLLCAQ